MCCSRSLSEIIRGWKDGIASVDGVRIGTRGRCGATGDAGAAISTGSEVVRTVQKVPAEWSIVHIGEHGRLLPERSQPWKPLRGSDLDITARMAMQVQT